MRLCYILLSPTFGMHQYTADLANRMATEHEVHLLTSRHAPGDRYGPAVTLHRPVAFHNTGLSPQTLRLDRLLTVWRLLRRLQPDVVHFTGPHLWNGLLATWLRRRGVHVIHTIHDLNAHAGRPLGSLLGLWNRSVMAQVDTVLVHGRCYHQHLLGQEPAAGKVYYLPLLHLFLSYEWEQRLEDREQWKVESEKWIVSSGLSTNSRPPADNKPGSGDRSRLTDTHPLLTKNLPLNYLLFFGRLKLYKGVADLLAAFEQVAASGTTGELVLAGPGELPQAWRKGLPAGVRHHKRLIEDEEAVALFGHCRAVVLPYIDATHSALVAAAYFFNKPVIVTESGALPEYVENGRTGLIVPVSDPAALAEALRYTLTHPQEMAHMGRNGRDWYNEQRQQEYKALCRLYNEKREMEN
jgi:glycosyltransferase involved in cell wall biosynthesis